MIGSFIPPSKEESAFRKLRASQGVLSQAFGPEIETVSSLINASRKLGSSFDAFLGYAENLISIPFVSHETYVAKT